MKKKLGIAALVLAILLTGYSVAASLSLRGLGAYRLSTGLGRVLSLSWQYTALAAVLLWALLAAAMRLKKRRQKSKLAPAAGERPQQPAARPEKPRPARKSEKPSAKVSEKKAKIPPAKGKGASSATPDLSQQEALSGKTELICADAEKKAMEFITKNVKRMSLKSKSVEPGRIELDMELRLKEADTGFINELSRLDGILHTVLVSYNGDYMS